MDYLVPCRPLFTYCKDVFLQAGLTEKDAAATAELLVHADLRGVYSHGVCRVLEYVRRIKLGSASAEDRSGVVREVSCLTVMDGGNVLGPVAAEKAVALAREKAGRYGLAMVVVRNSNHYGMAAHWALKLAGEDMIGFSSSDSDPCLAPFGGARSYIGNNPFSYAVSGNTYKEICLDIACSMIAGGKKQRMIERGERMPDNWFLTADGKPTTDPREGAVALPFGGHKGSGLSFFMEVLTSALSGGAFGADMPGFMHLEEKNPTSHCFMAIDIAALRTLEDFRRHLDNYILYVKSCPRAEGVEEIYYPGEIEYRAKQRSLAEGVMLSEGVVNGLVQAGALVGMPPEACAFLRERGAEQREKA